MQEYPVEIGCKHLSFCTNMILSKESLEEELLDSEANHRTAAFVSCGGSRIGPCGAEAHLVGIREPTAPLQCSIYITNMNVNASILNQYEYVKGRRIVNIYILCAKCGERNKETDQRDEEVYGSFDRFGSS